MSLTKEDHKWVKKVIEVAKTSRNPRAQVGCILVKNGKMLVKATNGYHDKYDYDKLGNIRGMRHVKSGTQREIDYGLCAESFALSWAAKKGLKVDGATAYVTAYPCRICESLLTEAGIKRVVYIKHYYDILPQLDVFADYGVEVVHAAEYEGEV